MNYIWNNDTLSLHDGDTLVAEIGFSTIDDGNTYVVERTWVSDAYRGQGIAGKITTTFITRLHMKYSPITSPTPSISGCLVVSV